MSAVLSGALSSAPTRRRVPDQAILLALLVAAVCLAATWTTWKSVEHIAWERTRTNFEDRAAEFAQELRHRLDLYENTLHGAASLFAAGAVMRKTWSTYVRGLNREAAPQSIRTLGFGEHVTAAGKSVHGARIRSEGAAGYAIRPRGERSEYGPATYVEYFIDTGGPSAAGYDMLSEGRRAAAIARARDTGTTSITDRLSPAVDPQSPSAVYLIYHPVYSSRTVPETVAERRSSIRGYTYIGADLGVLLAGLLREKFDVIRVEFFASELAADASSVFDSHPAAATSSEETLATTISLEFAGELWLLRFNALPQFAATIEGFSALVIAAAGVLVSVLLGVIAWSIATSHVRTVACLPNT